MIELPEGIKRCPSCTYNNIEHGPAMEVTYGCEICFHTGRGRFWRAYGTLQGGHYHVRVFVGGSLTGVLVMDQQDWTDFKNIFNNPPISEVKEVA